MLDCCSGMTRSIICTPQTPACVRALLTATVFPRLRASGTLIEEFPSAMAISGFLFFHSVPTSLSICGYVHCSKAEIILKTDWGNVAGLVRRTLVGESGVGVSSRGCAAGRAAARQCAGRGEGARSGVRAGGAVPDTGGAAGLEATGVDAAKELIADGKAEARASEA